MGAITDDPVGHPAREIDPHAEAVADHDALRWNRALVVVIEQRALTIQPLERRVGHRGLSGEQSQLIQRGAGLYADGKRLGRDLEIERAAVAGADLVEAR